MVLEILLGVGALGGGIVLMAGPHGEIFPLPVSALAGSPFADYFAPGAILFTVLGLGPMAAAVAAWQRRWIAPLLSFAAGCALLIWLIVEIEVVGYSSQPPLQALYLGLGVVMTLVGAEWIREAGWFRGEADATAPARPTTAPSMRSSIRARPLIWFFVIAFSASWLAWSPLTLAALGLVKGSPPLHLHLLGGLGPMFAAVLVNWGSGDRAALRRLRDRSLTLRGGTRWVLAALLLPAALFALSLLVLAVFDAAPVRWNLIGVSTEYPGMPRPVFWLANVLFYGFGEEVGWRGFALPRIQARRSALSSALLLGFAWAGWHLPLFAFSEGLSGLGIGGTVGWLMSILTGSVLMAWFFNSSRGSVLAVAIFHGVLDIFMTSPVVPHIAMAMGAILTIGTLALIPLFGPSNLARHVRTMEEPRQP